MSCGLRAGATWWSPSAADWTPHSVVNGKSADSSSACTYIWLWNGRGVQTIKTSNLRPSVFVSYIQYIIHIIHTFVYMPVCVCVCNGPSPSCHFQLQANKHPSVYATSPCAAVNQPLICMQARQRGYWRQPALITENYTRIGILADKIWRADVICRCRAGNNENNNEKHHNNS